MDLNGIMAVNLRRTRHGVNMSQEELAHRCGLSTRYIGDIERGKKSASLTVLGLIADALGADPVELITRKPDPDGDISG